MRPKAAEYDRLYPGALDDEAQMEERMERIETKRRRGSRRYHTVPDLPWKESHDKQRNSHRRS